jgi:hypothetical protein
MNGSNLTNFIERPGRFMYIVPIRSDTLPLKRRQKNYINLSLVQKKNSRREKIKTFLKCETKLSYT